MKKCFGFKEWKRICDLLEGGTQSIILRKGGISEGKHGFSWLHPDFFLFPTYFHEQDDQLRLAQPDPPSLLPTNEAENIEIRLWAEIVETAELASLDAALQLNDLHAWTEEVVKDRFGWGDREGLSVAVLRVWKLDRPWILENRKGFGGCRSWLGLPTDESLDPEWRAGLRRAVPEEELLEVGERIRAAAEK